MVFPPLDCRQPPRCDAGINLQLPFPNPPTRLKASTPKTPGGIHKLPHSHRLHGRAGVPASGAHNTLKIYEATRQHEYTLSELQEHLGLHYSTISQIASRVEQEGMSKKTSYLGEAS